VRVSTRTITFDTASDTASATLPDRPDLSPARRRLFVTALRLMSRNGYHGVSVRDIVRELDQHPTAIYAHVSSKQELIFELIRIAHEELRDRVRTAVLTAGSDPVDQLKAIVTSNVLTHLTFPELARVAHSEHDRLTNEQRAVIDVYRADLGRLLRDVVHRGVAQGVFAPDDVETTVVAIVTMGVRIVDFWTPDMGVDIQHIAAKHADLAVRMLSA
jgi:AcrR family transcriptional regulator